MRGATLILAVFVVVLAAALVCALYAMDDNTVTRNDKIARENMVAPAPPSTAQLLDQLDSGTPAEQDRAFMELRTRDRERMNRLYAIAKKHIRDKKNADRARLAVSLLVERGNENVPEFLVENAAVELSERLAINASPLNLYVFAKALVTLGQSAIPETIWYLRLTSPRQIDEKAIDVYAQVLWLSCSDNDGGLKEVIGVVERARDRALEQQRENLDRVLAKLREYEKKGK